MGNAAQVDPAEWWREVEINLRGPFLCAHAVLPGMIARRRGRIINIVSAAGLQAIETVSAYGVSKAALIRLTETLAAETQPYGIAVLAAHPGTVRTPMSEYVLHLPRYGTRAAGSTMVSAALCRRWGYADGASRCVYARSGFRACRCFVRLLSERGRRSGGFGRPSGSDPVRGASADTTPSHLARHLHSSFPSTGSFAHKMRKICAKAATRLHWRILICEEAVGTTDSGDSKSGNLPAAALCCLHHPFLMPIERQLCVSCGCARQPTPPGGSAMRCDESASIRRSAPAPSASAARPPLALAA